MTVLARFIHTPTLLDNVNLMADLGRNMPEVTVYPAVPEYDHDPGDLMVVHGGDSSVAVRPEQRKAHVMVPQRERGQTYDELLMLAAQALAAAATIGRPAL